MSSAGDRLYARLAPVASYDAANGLVVKALADTLADPQQIVDDVARDTATRRAWQAPTDPDVAPEVVLAWLAQLPGVVLLASDTVAQRRARIKAAAGFYRGTPRAIREEVQQTLTGSKVVQVLERVSGNVWSITVVTRTSETPNATVTAAAAQRQKPAGFLMTVVVSDDPIWAEATLAWSAVGAAETWQTLVPGDV